MMHAICDFCGHDAGRNVTLLTMAPITNFPRYHTDTEPCGRADKTRSFMICCACAKKHGLPNPYETYTGITDQQPWYSKCLDNYTDEDLVNDKNE